MQSFYSINSLLITHSSSLWISEYLLSNLSLFLCLGHENKLDPTAVRFPYEDDILIFNQSRLMINLEGTVYILDSKVQRAHLTCDVIRKVAPFVLSKLWILVADWSMRWSRDTFLIKLRLYSLNKEIQISKSIKDAPFTITPSMRNEKIITKFSFLMEFFKKFWQHQFSFCNKACQGQRRNAYLLQHYSQTLSNKVLLWALIKPKLWNQVPAGH